MTRHKTLVLRSASDKYIEFSPTALYHASKFERVMLIREGLPAVFLEQIVRKMDMSKGSLFTMLRLPRLTVERKIRNKDRLSAEHSERVIGLGYLVGQVEDMVAQSGNSEGFDADRWFGEWLNRPLPALNGTKPADFMDTMAGQEILSNLLAQSRSGAYA